MSDVWKPAPDQALAVLATLSDVPTEVLQSRTQERAVGRVRSAAAHVLRVDCELKVKEVAPLLGRTEQTVCDFSRNARLGLEQGDDVGELIERARQLLYDHPPTVATVSMTVPEPEDQVPRAPKPRALRLPHLRAWRSRRGWDQAQLAEAAGVARETIGRLEHGRAGRRDVILSLADALDVAPSELTGTPDLDALMGLEYRMCKGCRARRPAHCFVPIRGTPYRYLRCRMCRAARARERYHASSDDCAKQLARAQRNYRRRKKLVGGASA